MFVYKYVKKFVYVYVTGLGINVAWIIRCSCIIIKLLVYMHVTGLGYIIDIYMLWVIYLYNEYIKGLIYV